MTSPDAQPSHHFVQAPVQPLDEDGVQVCRIGTLVWLVAGVVLWLRRDGLRADGHGWYLWVCLAGVLLGLVGLWWCTWRRGRRN